MYLIRDARAADLDGLHDVARHLDSVNLPDDRQHLAQLIASSEESFAGRRDVPDRRFLFVLIDDTSGRLVGTSMIFAQHGTLRAPHVYFDVREEERYSQTLNRHFTHRVLRIGYNYRGLTEIGGLVLLPEMRRHPARLGTLLSYVRFVYMAAHRAIFRDEVVSELMPPLEPDGTSRLWEALGRKFTGLTYQQADRLSHENKEFIRTLFPEDPIYATLLPAEVQEVIGQVGPETKGVEKLLRRIGFTYANRIDPFDGGPHFHARIDDVTLVRNTRRVRSTTAGPSAPKAEAAQRLEGEASTPVLVTAEDGAGAPGHRFRALSTHAALDPGGATIALGEAEYRALGIAPGAEVFALPLASPE